MCPRQRSSKLLNLLWASSYRVTLSLVIRAEDDRLLASLEAAASGARALEIDGIDILEVPHNSISPSGDPKTTLGLDLSLGAECLKDTRGFVDLYGDRAVVALTGVDLLLILRELEDKERRCSFLQRTHQWHPR